jgi:hypothetical protein
LNKQRVNHCFLSAFNWNYDGNIIVMFPVIILMHCSAVAPARRPTIPSNGNLLTNIPNGINASVSDASDQSIKFNSISCAIFDLLRNIRLQGFSGIAWCVEAAVLSCTSP